MNKTTISGGMIKQQFAKALEEFRKILGEENVRTDPRKLRSMASFIVSGEPRNHAPSAALFPETAEQTSQIVKTCNRYKVPIWTSSTGKNIGYGAMAPPRKGTVVLSLKRMNRIVEVDPRLCYALVEPGVTYRQLYEHIRSKGHKLWLNIPTGPTPVAGPLGTSIERGTGYTPYGNNFEHVCGMEVVMPDGELLRTGMGGIPNSTCWQLYKWGYGPWLDGLFSQGNFGICVKMGIWLMPEPEDFFPFAIVFPRDEDLCALVEILRPLRLSGAIPNTCSIAPSYGEKYAGPWNIYAALYGTSEQNRVNWDIVTKAFSGIEGVQFYTRTDLCDHPSFQIRSNLMKGVVPAKPYSKFKHANWFVPIVPTDGDHVRKQKRLADEIVGSFGLNYNAELIVGIRSMHHVMEIPFDKSSEEQVENSVLCYRKLIEVFAENGYGLYRTSILFMDEVAETYGPEIRKVFGKIKRALDPNGIVAPGKSGIG